MRERFRNRSEAKAPRAGTDRPEESQADGATSCQRDEGLLRVDAEQRCDDAKWSREDWRDYLVFGRRPEPTGSFRGVVEDPVEGKIGIACSGGGIRSASFSLGALQVLQSKGVLQRASYLASVSGGSYIASAFCMLRKTWEGKKRPEEGDPGWDDSDPSAVTRMHPPFYPGSPEEQYLRNRSSYMAHGALGKLRLLYRVLLGLITNLGFLLLLLLLVAVSLAVIYGWLYPDLGTHVDGNGTCGDGGCPFTPLEIPTELWATIVGIAAAALLIGIASLLAYRWTPFLRDVTATVSARLMILSVALGAFLIGIPELLSLVRALGETTDTATLQAASGADGAATSTRVVATAAGSGLVTVGSAVALHLRAEWAKAQGLFKQAEEGISRFAKLSRGLQRTLAYALAAVVGPLIALALVLVAMSATLNREEPAERWIVLGALALTFVVSYRFADLTTWSLNSFYRRRLCSAFALKRVRPGGSIATDRFGSGKAVERDYDKLISLSKTAIEPGPAPLTGPKAGDADKWHWPTLLVCAAANISDNAATPPGRAVTSFTFSAGTMGGPLVGAVRTKDMESECDARRRSYFTLPAAVAMSGAALSPSMGKSTRKPIRLLLGIANIRLGVWVPNPRRSKAFGSDGRGGSPRPRPSYLLRELFGLNPLNAPFLYVTDGGHYENLGLVELLRRGCTEIYVIDSSLDKLDALGDAVSLARSELNVEIDNFDRSLIQPDKETGCAKQSCTEADITYPMDEHGNQVTGKLYFIRTVMTSDLPADVLAYHTRDPDFPQNSTGDQLYTDQRFEAYRALGVCAARNALGLKDGDYPPQPAGLTTPAATGPEAAA